MPILNSKKKEIDIKIVYYGPALCGKTTNLQTIFKKLAPHQRGEMVSLATKDDRTLFFDFLPIELGNVRGYKTRFHVYTVPGQVYYGLTRRAVLTNFDGVIFVADSQVGKMEENIESFNDLEENLKFYKKDIYSIPFIIQYNKRDLPNIISVEELNATLNKLHSPYFEACAIKGPGVMETLTACCKQILRQLDAVSVAHNAPVIKIIKESEPSPIDNSLPFRPPASALSKEEFTCRTQPQPEIFSTCVSEEVFKETPAIQLSAHGETTEKILIPETVTDIAQGSTSSCADAFSASKKQHENVPMADNAYNLFAGVSPKEQGYNDFSMETSSPSPAPLTPENGSSQGPVIRITTVAAESDGEETPFNTDAESCVAREELPSAEAPPLVELSVSPISRISIENLEEEDDTREDHVEIPTETLLETTMLSPEEIDLKHTSSMAPHREELLSPKHSMEAPNEVAAEEHANFRIVACGQPHKETETAVKIPLIFKIEELKKECLISLIIKFNDFILREPR